MIGKKYATLDDVEVLVRKLLRKIKGQSVGTTGGGGRGGGASFFVDLADVPGSYLGESGHLVRVKAGEDGLEFYDPPELCLGDLCDVLTESAYAPTDGDCLIWDAGLGAWVPAACGGGSGGGGGAPADAEYIVGAANGGLSAERVKKALYKNFDIDDEPAAPDAMDDEFDDGAIDPKWTKVNDPGGADAMNETSFPGFLHVGLPEAVTDDFAHAPALHQAPPAGSGTWAFILKAAIGCHALESSTDAGEFLSVALYLAKRADNVDATVLFQLNDAIADWQAGRAQGSINFSTPTFNNYQLVPPAGFVYLKLEKATANAYTSANTYNMYFSLNGITWYHVGQHSKTFTNAPDELGIYFRPPKPQGGTPWGYSVVDFFRKVA